MVLVVLFHAGIGVPGGFVGVDVFFVLSGFLITGLLVDELDLTGRVSLTGFYARRVRRLLPLSALVLVVTAFLSALVLAPLAHASVADDIRSAALWVSNWHFAAGATQYMADTAQSPVLHYWSLSLEEQFYVVWPLLILLVVRSAGRWSAMARRRLATTLGLVLVVTLLLSAGLTSSLGPWAYFGLQTRAWELAVGAALSLAVLALAELPLPIAGGAGWIGLLLIGWAALSFGTTTPYPGVAAVVPVAGAALVVASGTRTRGVGAAGLLSAPLLVHVGRRSYAWYLWHWPMLVLAAALAPSTGDPGDGSPTHAPFAYVLAAVVLSYVLAELSHRWVEQPVRRSPWFTASRGRSLALGAALTVTTVVLAGNLLDSGTGAETGTAPVVVPVAAGASAGPSATTSTGRGANEGAATSGKPSAQPSSAPVALTAMTPAQARVDGSAATACYVGYATTTADPSCRYGARNGSRVVALIGDSHAAMWLPALDRAGKARGWQVYLWSKSSCPMTEVGIYLPAYTAPYSACDAWRADVLRRLAALPRLDAVVVVRSKGYTPDLVLDGQGSAATPSTLPALWQQGTHDLVTRLKAIAPQVVMVEDTPWALGDVPDCLSAHVSDPSACAFPRSQRAHLDAGLVAAEKAGVAGIPGVRFVDPTSLVCPGSTCQVVTPTGVIVYRDGHHLTRTFSRTLAAKFGRLIAPSLG